MAEKEQDTKEAEQAISKAFAKPADPEPAESGFAKYNGQASTRRITKADWASIGIKADFDTIWHFGNDFQISLDDLSDEQVDYLRRDGLFTVGG